MDRTIAFAKTEPDPTPIFSPITDTFDGTGSLPADYILKGAPGGTYTSTLNSGTWELRVGSAPTGQQKHLRPITGAVTDDTTVYQLEVDYNSIQANAGAVLYISINDVSSTTGDLVTITGGDTATDLYLDSNTAATDTITFTLPAGSDPHVLIKTSGLANRGVNITEIRITEL